MEKKLPNQLATVDPESQEYIREVTRPYIEEMVGVLVNIARDKNVGPRDRAKAAVRVIDYYSRGGSPEAEGEGRQVGVIVINASNTREQDEAADELRRLNRLTSGSKQ